VQSRDGSIARPEQVYRIVRDTPRNYALLPGADAAQGHEFFGFMCSDCHGKDGRDLPLDGGFSLGSFARARADEAWFKIQNGLAGSPMKGMVSEPSGERAARTVLEMLAALCDRERFLPAASNRANDVPDGDPRCGAYLK
jgi:mono/diheme cytochrome c family protein